MPENENLKVDLKNISDGFSRSVERLHKSLNRFNEKVAERKRTRHLRYSEEVLERMYQRRLKQERGRGLDFVNRKVLQVRRELGLPLTWEN